MAPRDGSGIYSTPPGTHGIPDTTILSTPYNANVDDVAQDLNTPRPIVAGGTGASSPSAACSNLGAVAKTGDTMTGGLTIAPVATNANLSLDKAGSGYDNTIYGSSNGAPRWVVELGNTEVESGGNAGSNLSINRYNDAGSYLGTPLIINRANGQATFSQPVNITAPNNAILNLSDTSSVPWAATINSLHNGAARWRIFMGDGAAESGSNSGSNFGIYNCNDAGSMIGQAFGISRATGQVSMPLMCNHGPTAKSLYGSAINIGYTGGSVQYGIAFRPSIDGTRPCQFNNSADTEVGSITISGTNTNYNTSSDGRLKTNIKPIDAGDAIDAINAVRFNWKSTGEVGHGVIAQEAQAILPEAVVHDEERDTWGTDYSKFVPLLLAEVKALRARVAALEGK